MTRFALLWLLLPFATTIPAAAQTGPKIFDFKDPKQMNAVSLSIDALWEPVVGYADGVTGTATFDPAKPEATTGKITVAVSSVRFSNEGYTKTARFYALQEEKYPTITCELKKIVSGKVVKTGVYEGMVLVDFTCRGVTKPLTVPIRVAHLPGVGTKRFPDAPGDLLTVRCNFTIRRSDFGIAKDVNIESVAEEVEVRVALVGTEKTPKTSAPKPRQAADAPKDISITQDGKTFSVAERMAFYKVPGVSVAVIKNFAVERIVHYGEAASGKPTADETLYMLGSMAQPIVAAAALKAWESGNLSLDEDIRPFCRTWKIPPSPFLTAERGITVRDLLTHRSGFTYGKYSGYAPDGPFPTLAAVLKGEQPAVTPPATLAFAPGSRFAFGMEGYAVLQQVLEDRTGQPFETLLRAEILEPLGMKRTTFAQPSRTDKSGTAAVGHDENGVPLPGGWRIYPEAAASGMWSTPREFAGFLVEILRCAAGKGGTYLKRETARILLEAIPGSGDSPQAMGFGLSLKDGKTLLFRGGNAAGYYCHLNADPETGEAVIIFTNGNLCWRLANEIRDSIIAPKK